MASEVGAERRPLRTFFDSNILVYAEDSAHPAKQAKAIELIAGHARSRTAVLSIQVLGEYFNAAVRKLHVDARVAREQVEFYARLHVVEPNAAQALAAIDLHRLQGYSYWDCLVLRCAKEAACSILLTEDMQHGQVVDGVRIVNPFI